MTSSLDYSRELEDAASWVHSHAFSRVAIQFGDGDLASSSAVINSFKATLQSKGVDLSKTTVFALADSTYNPLDIDEVAGAHFNAECIIHLGRASLAPVTSLPAFLAFGHRALEGGLPDLIRTLQSKLASSSSDFERTVIVLDQPLLHYAPDLAAGLGIADSDSVTVARASCRELFPRGLPQRPSARPLSCSTTTNNTCCGADPSCSSATQTAPSSSSSTCEPSTPMGLAGYVWKGWESTMNLEYEAAQRRRFIWVGPLDAPALRELQMLAQASTWLNLEPSGSDLSESEGLVPETQRLLKKRYFLLEKARTASIVGILVGTLGVAGFSDAVHRIRRLAEEAGKKTYTALVGKPSPAKLANFPEVEVWVHVASSQGVLLDSKEYLAPVITVFEAELALRDLDWPSQYRLSLDPIESEDAAGLAHKSDSPRFSLVTGGVISSSKKAAAAMSEDASADSQLALATERALKLREEGVNVNNSGAISVQSAAEYLIAKRTFQGLETPSTGAEKLAPMVAIEGLSGRAAAYEGEGNK